MNTTENEKEFIKESYHKLKAKRQRNILLSIITIILILIGMIWAANLFYRHYKYIETNDATIEQYISTVNTRIAGYVKEIRFSDHQWVNQGDTLLIIDDREFRIKLLDAEANLIDAQNSASVLESNIETSISNIGVSLANVDEAKAKLWRAEQDMLRYKNLLESESVSQQQYDQIKADYNALLAHYNALQKQQKVMESTSIGAERKRGNTQAAILRAEAALDMARLNLSYTVITASYSGYVGRRTLENGQYVQAGQTVTNLIKNTDKWVIANYKETQIEHIHIGQDVYLKVDAISGKEFKGKVTAISEATGAKYSMLPTDNSAGNFVKIQQRIPIRIDFEDISDSDMKLFRAGMMVTAEIIK